MEKKTEKTEHILACLSSSPSNAKIIRTTAQMAEAFNGSFTALYVKTPANDNLTKENEERLQENIRLAEKLGADIATVYGEDVSHQITEFARLSNITKIVLGRSRDIKHTILKRHSITDKLIKSSPNLDIHIIPDADIRRTYISPEAFKKIHIPSWKNMITMLAVLMASTGIGYIFHRLNFTEANIITIYILGTMLTALFTKNYICSGICSFIGVILFIFFFTEPRLSLRAYESGYPITFAIMLIASLIIGTLANKLADNAKQSAKAAYRTKVMLDTNQMLQKANDTQSVIEIMAMQLTKLLARNIIVYPVIDGSLADEQFYTVDTDNNKTIIQTKSDRKVAQWTLKNKKRAGAGTNRMNNTPCQYLAVKTSDEVYCIIGIDAQAKAIEPFENSILMSIIGECAIAIQNIQNAKEKEKIAILAKNEQTRANLLRAISHDLRTPLTSISGNAENLLYHFNEIDEDTRKHILTDVYEDSGWLISLVENLLSITRINDGRMELNMSSYLVDEVIAEALKHISHKAKEHNILTKFDDNLLLAKMDARLISQVIINLVDNAIKYTPINSDIIVATEKIGNKVRISVTDNGNGIPDDIKPKVFKMFYTGENKIADCRRSLGLGLSLCQSIVNAHESEIILCDNTPKGCNFYFELPIYEVNLNE